MKIPAALLSAAASFALSAALLPVAGPAFSDRLDSWFAQRENFDPVPRDVVIVKVDNASLDALQRSDLRLLALQKSVFARLLDVLYGSGAKAVGLDVVFANRAEDEGVLAAALARHPRTVIGAKAGFGSGGETALPLPAFSGAVWGAVDLSYGGASALADRAWPRGRAGGRDVEAFGIAVWRAANGAPLPPAAALSAREYRPDPLRFLPLGEDGKFLVRFSGGPGVFPSYSLSDVLAGRFPAGAFSGKIVLVGESGTLVHDAQFTPADPSRRMPGVEIHAHAAAMLAQNRSLAPAPRAWVAAAMAAAALAVALAALARGYLPMVLAFLAAALLFPVGSRLLAALPRGVLFPGSAPALAALVSLFASGAWRYFVADRGRRFVTSAFSRYLSPEMVRRLAADPSSLRLGGEEREVTVLFADLAGFTSLTERLGTRAMFPVLSEFLAAAAACVTREGGTVDKFIGDAVMAFWGAPADDPRHAERAVRAALGIRSGMAALNAGLAARGLPPLSVRVGLHTDVAVVGNVGSRDRFDYTAIGDGVNLASRLEGANKFSGTGILCSGEARRAAGEAFAWRELGEIRVKGRAAAVALWEPLGPAGTPDPAGEAYAAALARYRAGDFAAARDLFSAVPGDGPSAAMAARCADLLSGAARADGGVFSPDGK